MRAGQEVLDALTATVSPEWLLADGAGGSAVGNVAFIPSRRGHALLHGADESGRVTTVLLGVEERVHVEGLLYGLAPLPWLAALDLPVAKLQEFRLDPWPVWRLACGDLVLERSLFLIHERHAVAMVYRHLAGPAARLRWSPLLVSRAPEELQRETSALRGVAQGIPGRVRIETRDDGPTLTLWHNGTFTPARFWRRGIVYPTETRPRVHEDALVPGHLDAHLSPAEAVHLVASTEETLFRSLAGDGRLGTPPPQTLAGCVSALASHERARVEAFSTTAVKGSDFTARQAASAHGDDEVARRVMPLIDGTDGWTLRLVKGVEQGLVRRAGRLTMATGFPAAEERGIEALRSLPGLVAVRAFAEAHGVLRGYIEYLDDGAVPEAFDSGGVPRYGDPEPALWAIHGAELLARRSEDLDWLRNGLFAQLESIMQFYRSGTRHGVRVGTDGLLEHRAGEETLRPAGLNALWYHALVAMAQLARLTGRKESAAFYLAWARQHGEAFNGSFWNAEAGRLHEALGPEAPRPGFTPRQILAASLAPAVLAPEHAIRLVETAERELFTPLGLRDFPGSARLDPAWLGPFYTAYLRVHGRSLDAQGRVQGWLEELRLRLIEDSTGPIAALYEIPPHRPGRRTSGAPLQSARARGASPLAAAELLRVWIEDVSHATEASTIA